MRKTDASPAYRPLRDLVLVAFGPREVITQEFGSLNGLDGLMIYGSWAARYNGQQGPEPGDIDVLIIGNVDRDDAYDAAERAQNRLCGPERCTMRTTPLPSPTSRCWDV